MNNNFKLTLMLIIFMIFIFYNTGFCNYLFCKYDFKINNTTYENAINILKDKKQFFKTFKGQLPAIKRIILIDNDKIGNFIKKYMLTFGTDNKLKSIVIYFSPINYEKIKNKLSLSYSKIGENNNTQHGLVSRIASFNISKDVFCFLEKNNYDKFYIYLRYTDKNFFKQIIKDLKNQLIKLLSQTNNK